MSDNQSYDELFEKIKGLKIAIIGDIMIDAYVYGHVDRISPEAPVPVLLVDKKEQRPGGAANVAMNIRSMGATPILISLVGSDRDGSSLINLLEDQGVESSFIVKNPNRTTTTKTRILAKGHQMMRLDHEHSDDVSSEMEDLILGHIENVLNEDKPDAIIFQDYNKGLLTEKIIRGTTMMCLNLNIPVAVDPKKKNFLAYQMCTLFKPNLREISDNLLTDVNPDDLDSLTAASEVLRKNLHNGITLITLSDKGIYLNSGETNILQPAHIRNISDVSGAGDTVISVATLCLAAKAQLPQIAFLSNLAGGIVCEYPGVVSISPERLLEEALKLEQG